MRKIGIVCTLFFLLTCSVFPSSSESNSKREKPNVLLITIDTLRPDRLSCYSDKHLKTPNIDTLAEKGITFTRAFAHTPTTLPSHTNIILGATPLYHGGDIMAGIKLLSEIIEERKDFDQAYSYLATLYKEQGNLIVAVETLRSGLKNNPSSYKIIITYGILLIEIGQYDAAIEILRKGLDIIDHDPELWNYLGVAYWSKGDFKNAVDAYQKALALDSNYPIVFNNLGSLYLSKSLKSKNAGDLQNADENFKKAIELDPNYASAYNGLGSVYGQTGNIDAAIKCWNKAVELSPELSFPLYNLGLAYLSKGNKSKALEFLKRYRKENYSALSKKEKTKLDALIQQCGQKQKDSGKVA